jgi:outer membrane protein assembly factor BamB
MPVVADGITYIRSPDGSIEALRASDGSLLWQYTSPSPPLSGISPLVMLGSDGMVYVITEDEALYVLRSSDGSVFWHTKAGEIILGIAAGVAYVSTPGGGLDTLRARNGSWLWHSPRTQ